MMAMEKYFIGVDVGSQSARVGVFNQNGGLISSSSQEILIHSPAPGIYEQSSENIWSTIVTLVKNNTANLDPSKIHGIAFCATCSLVAVGPSAAPISISLSQNPKWDIIMWMDHRAQDEAELINNGNHKVLQYVGGKISLEMQTPKLLWLKKNLPENYHGTKEYFDLPDFLRWKTTRKAKRSMCSVVCKWTHVHSPEGNHWDTSYFKAIGIEDCIPKIGGDFSFPGDSDVIAEEAAKELGLPLHTRVGYSLIDAHSGVLGMMGCSNKPEDSLDFTKRLALICGTSNCHMALSKRSCMVPGVWGPYYGVIFPNLYLNEGGQSAAGKLLDELVTRHPAYEKMMKELGNNHGKVLSKLEEILTSIEKSEGIDDAHTSLTKDLHIWPDFHGNRSPLADPTMKGMMSGLTLAKGERDLAVLYLATIQALGYGSLYIMQEMIRQGHDFTSLVICGGLAKSKLFLQTHADILRIPVLVPYCREPVLLGAAISAASTTVSGVDKTDDGISEIAQRMGGGAEVIVPNEGRFRYHERKFAVFLEMLKDQLKYKQMMET